MWISRNFADPANDRRSVFYICKFADPIEKMRFMDMDSPTGQIYQPFHWWKERKCEKLLLQWASYFPLNFQRRYCILYASPTNTWRTYWQQRNSIKFCCATHFLSHRNNIQQITCTLEQMIMVNALNKNSPSSLIALSLRHFSFFFIIFYVHIPLCLYFIQSHEPPTTKREKKCSSKCQREKFIKNGIILP